jgi:hypothetical protein
MARVGPLRLGKLGQGTDVTGVGVDRRQPLSLLVAEKFLLVGIVGGQSARGPSPTVTASKPPWITEFHVEPLRSWWAHHAESGLNPAT